MMNISNDKTNETMRLRLYMLAVVLLTGMAAMAQDVAEQKKLINEIKKNPEVYLYYEAIDDNEADAKTRAAHFLRDEIDEYVQEQEQLRNAKNIVTMNIQTQSITMARGDKFRAFAYIKKSDIIAADNASVLGNDRTAAPQPQAPVAAEPEPVAVTPADEPAAEPAPAEESAPVSLLREGTIARLTALTKFSELKSCLNQLQQEGRIGHYAKHKELDNPANYVLVVYNRDGGIEAVLSEGPERVNLKTGQPDEVSNYPGRGAFGVKVND